MNKYILKIILTLAMLVSLTSGAFAEQTGTITDVTIRASDGLHYFNMTGSATNKPACAAHGYYMIKDENSVVGRHQLSALLTAYASGKTVRVIGMGTCTRWIDGEDLNAIKLN